MIMRHNLLTASLLLIGLSAFVVGGAAQKSQEEPKDQTTQGQSTPGMMGGGGMGRNEGRSQGTMGGGMMGNMGQMTTHHQQMSTLMSKLMDSMAAIQNEKDPAALQSKLAEHRALLDQMRGQMMQQGKMMEMMSGQVNANCGARGDAGKSGPQ
jgi:hypothetical protein